MDQVTTIINTHEARMHADLEVFRVVHDLHALLTDGPLAAALAAFDLTVEALDGGEGAGTSLRLAEVKDYIMAVRKRAEEARGLVRRIVDTVLPALQRIRRLAGGTTEDVTMLSTDEFLMGEETLTQAIEVFGRGMDELRVCVRIIQAVRGAAAALPGLHYDTQLHLKAEDKPPRKVALCVPVVKEFLAQWGAACDARHALAMLVDAELEPTRRVVEELCGCVHVSFEARQ